MESSQVKTPDGINWYIQRYTPSNTSKSSAANPIVLVPSGEGDCGSLYQLATLLSSTGYHVLTFDNPGFSRTTAPDEAVFKITPELFATQILTLLDTLNIPRAIFFGNSSGGCAVLSITVLHPERVQAAIVHEVPLTPFPLFSEQVSKTDDEISEWCAYFFANYFIEQEENAGREKWDALGPEYHARLRKNFIIWIHGIVENGLTAATGELVTGEALKKAGVPVFWTVGGMSDAATWGKDFEVAKEAGTEVRTDVVHALHFPYVSVPEKLRDWIVECIGRTEG